MSFSIKSGGGYKTGKGLAVKQGGEYKDGKKAWIKRNGVYEEFFSKSGGEGQYLIMPGAWNRNRGYYSGVVTPAFGSISPTTLNGLAIYGLYDDYDYYYGSVLIFQSTPDKKNFYDVFRVDRGDYIRYIFANSARGMDVYFSEYFYDFVPGVPVNVNIS